eukprot:2331254-Prymnesium_polylepis.1
MGMAAEPTLRMGDPIASALACDNWAGAPPSVAAAQGNAHCGARSAEQRAATSRPCMPARSGRRPTARGHSMPPSRPGGRWFPSPGRRAWPRR